MWALYGGLAYAIAFLAIEQLNIKETIGPNIEISPESKKGLPPN